MLMDTAQEKAIGLGADYPFEPLEAGECVLGSVWQSRKFKVNDTVTMIVPLRALMTNMAYQYDISNPDKTYADQNAY